MAWAQSRTKSEEGGFGIPTNSLAHFHSIHQLFLLHSFHSYLQKMATSPENTPPPSTIDDKPRVLIVGAGLAGKSLVRLLYQSHLLPGDWCFTWT